LIYRANGICCKEKRDRLSLHICWKDSVMSGSYILWFYLFCLQYGDGIGVVEKSSSHVFEYK
ncbi:hypothetical protein, partial [Corynebacterium matruchotii]|uniref:hypothetical protein n=1 Tax=Corynebacterium matruchotii TaxID=43768 RepID=UPI00288087D2